MDGEALPHGLIVQHIIIYIKPMGEVSEMMVSGVLCEACGMALDGKVAECAQDAQIPSYCDMECANESGATWWIDWVNEDFGGKVY